MLDAPMAGALLILATAGYWLAQSTAVERLSDMVTGERALTVGGFGAGLIWGPMVTKAAVGFVGGLGTLAIGNVINLSSGQFTLIVVGLIVAMMLFRGD